MADVSTNDITGYSAYLKSQGVSDSDIQGYTKYLADQHGVDHPSEKDSSPDIAQTALEHFANGATAGYLPQLQAAAQGPIFHVMNWLTGEDVKPDSYVNARDENVSRLAKESEINPKTAIGSEIAGAGAQALAVPMPSALEAGGIASGIAKGAGVGAAYGALSNPGDEKGIIDPLQTSARISNAEKGALIGGVAGGVTQGVAKGIKAVASAPQGLESAANAQAIKASGAMLKDFRALEGNDRTQALGSFALDKGIVQAGDTVQDVAQKAEAVRQDAGTRLDKIYGDAQTQIDKQGGSISGFNPTQDKSTILSQVKDSLGNAVGKKAALNQVSDYLDQLIEDHGDQILSPKTANDIEGEVSQKIKWARNPQNPEPTTESAFKELRSVISDKVDNQIQALGEQSGNPQIADQLAAANRDYGFSKQLGDMANDKINRILTNNRWTLTDRIAGGAGGVAGGMVGGMYGNDWRSEGAGTLIGGLGGALANHLGGQYGNAALAAGLNAASRVAEMGPSQAAGIASRAINPQSANVIARAASGAATAGGQIGSDESAPQRNAPNVTPAKSPPAKGYDKWANDGLQKLIEHSGDKSLSALRDNPKAKQLLISASDMKIGSKSMDSVLMKLRALKGSEQ